MPDVPSSAVRRALAAELRRLREHAGLSGDEVAEKLGWSASKVSRIETHRTGVKHGDLDGLLEVYAVDSDRRRELTALADEREIRGWWAAYVGTLPTGYVAYLGLEDTAVALRCWSPELIHGLLQTRDYAAATMRSTFGSPPKVPPAEIERRIEARLRRQQLFTRPGSREFSFVLDEAALRHRLGTDATMHAQLARLEEISALPDVTIQVMPFTAAYAIEPGGFTILQFAALHGTVLADLVYTEHLTGPGFVEGEAETYAYRLAFEQLQAEALDTHASRQLIADVAGDVWARSEPDTP